MKIFFLHNTHWDPARKTNESFTVVRNSRKRKKNSTHDVIFFYYSLRLAEIKTDSRRRDYNLLYLFLKKKDSKVRI